MTAAIVGIHEGPLDNEARGCLEVAAVEVMAALADAGIPLGEVDAVLAAYSWEDPSIMFASQLADMLGVTSAYVETVCFGGASPAMMIARATRAIELELCEVVVVAAASNRASKLGRARAISALRDVLSPEFEVPYGAFIPPVYALAATRYMHEYGVLNEHLAAVAVTQRDHAGRHPDAAQRAPITVSDVAVSPMIASPLHLLDCCLVTDFGAAAVITTAKRAKELGVRPVHVLGVGESHDRLTLGEVADHTRCGAAASAERALAAAGMTLHDVDFAELYDSFTITVLLTLEDIGFCPRGTAAVRAASGEFALDGALPVNTNGGMLSYRTGGLSHTIEAVEQLRGTPRGAALDAPRVGLVHGVGGTLSAHCTLVLGVG